jgi:hypothetical protein
VSTLGSKLRGLGHEALAYEAEKLVAQLGESESGKNYWFAEATRLQAELDGQKED